MGFAIIKSDAGDSATTRRSETLQEVVEMKPKTIALIAHDHKKPDIIRWAKENKEILSHFDLCGTGTTSKLVSEETGLDVHAYLSGPLGGDLQIGAKVAERKIDIVIFFFDPLQAQPHDPDIKALLRIAALYDVPIATNISTANYILHSDLLVREKED